MSDQVGHLIEAAVQDAREHWQLGDATITLVAERENRVFRVDSAIGPAALRLHRQGYRNVQQLHSELVWMKMLADNGIPVPEPIDAPDGSQIHRSQGVYIDLLTWVDGTPLSQIDVSADRYHELGRLLARMHTLADAWNIPEGFSRPTWDLISDHPLWGRFWENPQLTPEQGARLLKFRDTARSFVEALGPLDVGLIHADLVPDNVLLNGEQLQVIDFDDGGFGHRLFDLATITLRSRRQNSGAALAEACCDGYRTMRPFNEDGLIVFEALRACSYLGWNIPRIDEPGGRARNARFVTEAEAAIESFYAANI